MGETPEKRGCRGDSVDATGGRALWSRRGRRLKGRPELRRLLGALYPAGILRAPEEIARKKITAQGCVLPAQRRALISSGQLVRSPAGGAPGPPGQAQRRQETQPLIRNVPLPTRP